MCTHNHYACPHHAMTTTDTWFLWSLFGWPAPLACYAFFLLAVALNALLVRPLLPLVYEQASACCCLAFPCLPLESREGEIGLLLCQGPFLECQMWGWPNQPPTHSPAPFARTPLSIESHPSLPHPPTALHQSTNPTYRRNARATSVSCTPASGTTWRPSRCTAACPSRGGGRTR